MLGVVFTEFVDMVIDTFGEEVADKMLDIPELESDGAYTAVGTYSYQEMLSLVTNLSEQTGIAVNDLVQTFGRHLTKVFAARYAVFFENVADPFDFLESIDDHIHKEVLKLHPDALLPSFSSRREGADTLILEYSSSRPFGVLAHGLIEGSLEHFDCEATIDVEDLSEPGQSHVIFTVTKTPSRAS